MAVVPSRVTLGRISLNGALAARRNVAPPLIAAPLPLEAGDVVDGGLQARTAAAAKGGGQPQRAQAQRECDAYRTVAS